MLSRVADSLFWMSRYAERAESVARFLDVNLQMLMDAPAAQARRLSKDLLPLVGTFDCEKDFLAHNKKSTADSVLEYLVFDTSHPDGVAGSLSLARENARTVREQITAEMWEQINRTYLWMRSKAARQGFQRNRYDFFQRVMKTLQLFQGITDTTMLHGHGWEFMQLGKHLERADKTSRFLDEKFHLLRNEADLGGPDTLLQWVAVLNGCAARQNYQWLHAGSVQPMKVADLLILNEYLPHSVRFCVQQVDHSLRRLSGTAPGRFANPVERMSGRLLADLSFNTIEDICAPDFHTAMDRLQQRLNEIGAGVLQHYIHQELPPEPVASLTPEPAQPQPPPQQQQ